MKNLQLQPNAISFTMVLSARAPGLPWLSNQIYSGNDLSKGLTQHLTYIQFHLGPWQLATPWAWMRLGALSVA